MRVLAIGSLYPPQHLGGYELVWQGATRALAAAGHEVGVLCTDERLRDAPEEDDAVKRALRWYWHDHAFPERGFRERLAIERHNAATVRAALADGRPDVVAFWSMGGLSLSLLEHVRRAGVPAVAFVHDLWPVYGPHVDAWTRMWARRPRAARIAARVTGLPAGPAPGAVSEYLFVSDWTRREVAAWGWPVTRSRVAPSGIGPEFTRAREHPWDWRLLLVGRLDPRKGTDAALEALALVPEATLTIAGSGEPAHERELRGQADELGIADRVRWLGHVERSALPSVYAEHDVVMFPVRWAEPWGLVPLEAMAVGRPVVASGRGGSAEYLRDRENCLIADPDAPDSIAAAVRTLAESERLRARLVTGGRATAEEHAEARFHADVIAAVERVGSRP